MYMTLRAQDGHVFDAYVAGEETARAGIVVIQEITEFLIRFLHLNGFRGISLHLVVIQQR